MKKEILNILKSNDDFISGQILSDQFGITRAAIWKYITQLKKEGYEIESISRKGYRLISSPDLISSEEITPLLETKVFGKNIIHYDSIHSTNSQAKLLCDEGLQEGSVILSEEQTSGRGRLGRNWSSPKGSSISMSIVLKPEINPVHVSKVTQISAAALSLAFEDMDVQCNIKWPNDIIINNKKVCGILTEMSSELNKINYVVMGIGINVNIDEAAFPDDIKDIATSLKIEYGKHFSRKQIIASFLKHFEKLYFEFINTGSAEISFEICRKRSLLLGKDIYVIRGSERTPAKAVSIDENGELLVQYADGILSNLISGEVSVRKSKE